MHLRLRFLTVGLAFAAFAVPSANAGLFDPVLNIVAPTCGTTSHPFQQFGDNNSYYSFTNSTFENGTSGWTVSRGASVVADNEPFHVAGGGSHALLLEPGASVTSPNFCINLLDPAGRGFVKSLAANGDLQIQVIFHGLSGNLTGLLNVATLSGEDYASWQPTARFSSALALPLFTTSAQIRITAKSGSWEVDDIFVDPCINRLG
jgi:hypothetical protein